MSIHITNNQFLGSPGGSHEKCSFCKNIIDAEKGYYDLRVEKVCLSCYDQHLPHLKEFFDMRADNLLPGGCRV